MKGVGSKDECNAIAMILKQATFVFSSFLSNSLSIFFCFADSSLVHTEARACNIVQEPSTCRTGQVIFTRA